jgi:hypothetical protein
VDYIPRAETAFLDWATALVDYAAGHLADFKLEPADLAPVQALLADYRAKFAAAANPNHGKVDVFEKNTARNAFRAALRLFVKARLAYNPAVADTDRGNMDLPLRKKTRTPVPSPEIYPEAEIDSSVIRRLTIRFKDAGRKTRGKPQGILGAEIRWGIRAEPPASVEELAASAFATTTPHTCVFSEKQRGQKAYFCLCWKNTKGERGPWGEIINGIIP